MTVFIVGTSERSDASIREGAKELLSARVSARANPGGGDGAASGNGARRSLCSDKGLCAEGSEGGIPQGRAFWTCRVTSYRNLDNGRIEREKTWPISPNLELG